MVEWLEQVDSIDKKWTSDLGNDDMLLAQLLLKSFTEIV